LLLQEKSQKGRKKITDEMDMRTGVPNDIPLTYLHYANYYVVILLSRHEIHASQSLLSCGVLATVLNGSENQIPFMIFKPSDLHYIPYSTPLTLERMRCQGVDWW
jgi:hypothetical protein